MFFLGMLHDLEPLLYVHQLVWTVFVWYCLLPGHYDGAFSLIGPVMMHLAVVMTFSFVILYYKYLLRSKMFEDNYFAIYQLLREVSTSTAVLDHNLLCLPKCPVLVIYIEACQMANVAIFDMARHPIIKTNMTSVPVMHHNWYRM